MKVRIARLITILVIILNIIALRYIWKLLAKANETALGVNSRRVETETKQTTFPHFLKTSLTVVIRKFEHFENDVAGTVEAFHVAFPNVSIVVFSDTVPYPPISLVEHNKSINYVKIVSMHLQLEKSMEESNPLFYIHTKYVLFVPDSTRVMSLNSLGKIISEVRKHPHTIVSAPLLSSKLPDCLQIKLNRREWSVQYDVLEGQVCDAVNGKHVILLRTEILQKLPQPMMLPFPDAFYIQTAAQNIKVKRLNGALFSNGKTLFQSQHARWKLQQLEHTRQQRMFKLFGLKKVIRETGVVEWYGCTRDTPRCFGTVISDMPQYLWEGRWTPPCCLAGLRQTARHVFARLDEFGVRYWLEGGSLLGAMRLGDILPWDYDIDIGIYKEDIPRCPLLEKARVQSVVDDDGFVWEKATEGDFFRVQFSRVNHLHVDLFPFYLHNGTMTKDTWFANHKQDREFPEHYLHPMASIEFVGRQVPAPNNIRDFLELKFGKGVIENPEYPDPKKMVFSKPEIFHEPKVPVDYNY